jgi:hypothetical protein
MCVIIVCTVDHAVHHQRQPHHATSGDARRLTTSKWLAKVIRASCLTRALHWTLACPERNFDG